jgi:translocon-associated protein subunit alpha
VGGDEKEALSSPFAKTNILFVTPESTDLPAGRVAKLLIGFKNNGSAPFVVETVDGSFRYPQDFSYHIQNFSTYHFNKVIEADREATFEYVFTPSETFSSRQFGLTINLRYKSADGKSFINAVFNDTINVVEPEEGLDGETFFVYIFLGAIIILLFVGGNHLLSVFRKKGRSTKYTAHKISNGNGSADGVDYEWIPKEHLQQNKSPRVSPRQRKVKNGGGSAAGSGNSSADE